MSLTPSNMLSLGTKAPDFNLLNTNSNKNDSLDELKGSDGTLIMFICNHCPYVKHVNSTIANLAKLYHGNKINFIAISSNDVINYPLDSPELMREMAKENNFIPVFPPINLCSDNAAMIAWAGIERYNLNLTNNLEFPSKARWPLDSGAPFMKGAGLKL